MSKWIIDKEFAACFGHRVHNQRLDTRFTDNGDACLACRHLHGHQMIIKVFLESANIDENDMVTDFKHLGFVKNFIDDVIDHKFMIDVNDPILKGMFPLCYGGEDNRLNNTVMMEQNYLVPDLTVVRDHFQKMLEGGEITEAEATGMFEVYEGIIFVDFCPTSERLTEWLFHIVKDKMKDLKGVTVSAVEYWETPKSHSRFEG